MKKKNIFWYILPLSLVALVGAVAWLSICMIDAEAKRIINDRIIRDKEAKELAEAQLDNLLNVAIKDVMQQIVSNDGSNFSLPSLFVDREKTIEKLQSSINQLLPDGHRQPIILRRSSKDDSSLVPIIPTLPATTASPQESMSQFYQSLYLIWAGVAVAVLGIIVYTIRNNRLSETKTVFVSAVTHELRTPVANISMYSHLLNNNLVPEGKQKHYLDVLEQESLRLQHLVQNVLNYSSIEKNVTNLSLEELPLDQVADVIRARIDERLQGAGMQCVIELPEDTTRLALIADKTAFEQIIYNLADNAVKYARQDGGSLRIEFQLEENMVSLLISDQGKGIDEKMKKKLFLPFCRSSEMAAGKSPGVGLGLAISRHIARQMNGELQLVSSYALGTCFKLSLPRA